MMTNTTDGEAVGERREMVWSIKAADTGGVGGDRTSCNH